MNAIMAIHPYQHEGMWVFDDPAVSLIQEPFVAGADTLIDRATQGVPDAERGFTILFSRKQFPGAVLRLEWRRAEFDGNWYYSPDFDAEGWLCPALFKYFDSAPKEIFVQVKDKAT